MFLNLSTACWTSNCRLHPTFTPPPLVPWPTCTSYTIKRNHLTCPRKSEIPLQDQQGCLANLGIHGLFLLSSNPTVEPQLVRYQTDNPIRVGVNIHIFFLTRFGLSDFKGVVYNFYTTYPPLIITKSVCFICGATPQEFVSSSETSSTPLTTEQLDRETQTQHACASEHTTDCLRLLPLMLWSHMGSLSQLQAKATTSTTRPGLGQFHGGICCFCCCCTLVTAESAAFWFKEELNSIKVYSTQVK